MAAQNSFYTKKYILYLYKKYKTCIYYIQVCTKEKNGYFPTKDGNMRNLAFKCGMSLKLFI